MDVSQAPIIFAVIIGSCQIGKSCVCVYWNQGNIKIYNRKKECERARAKREREKKKQKLSWEFTHFSGPMIKGNMFSCRVAVAYLYLSAFNLTGYDEKLHWRLSQRIYNIHILSYSVWVFDFLKMKWCKTRATITKTNAWSLAMRSQNWFFSNRETENWTNEGGLFLGKHLMLSTQ